MTAKNDAAEQKAQEATEEAAAPAKKPTRSSGAAVKASRTAAAKAEEASEKPMTEKAASENSADENAGRAKATRAKTARSKDGQEKPAASRARRTRTIKSDGGQESAGAESAEKATEQAAGKEAAAKDSAAKAPLTLDELRAVRDAAVEVAPAGEKVIEARYAEEPAEKPAEEPARKEAGKASGKQQGQKGRSQVQKRDAGSRGGAASKKGGQSSSAQKHHRTHRQHVSQANREPEPSVTQEDLAKLKVAELRDKALELDIDPSGLKKAELVEAVFNASVKAEGFIEVEGVLDILADGYGFLRTQGYLPSEADCYVGLSMIRRNGLRKGDWICGQTRPPRENEKYAALRKISTINGVPAEEGVKRIRFGDLTPVYPDECLVMEHGKTTITARVIDLVSPIGKGQRGLIVSPPKAGKTTILKDIAASISANNPEVHLMCLLVDERPEEVTDMERSIKGEVISSTFDMPTENHIAVAELVIERAKRLVECGRDVVVLLDSLTRLARAYNLAQPASGRILSGGVDSTALYPPKRFLGAARNIEGGGSLTILASALVDTGSKMDEVIFEEFKGTGNMELKLDRNLADRRIFPAIDPIASGTRKEDLLLNPQEAPLIWAVRRILANMNSTERAVDMLIKSLKQTETNQEFLIRTAKKAQHHSGEGLSEL